MKNLKDFEPSKSIYNRLVQMQTSRIKEETNDGIILNSIDSKIKEAEELSEEVKKNNSIDEVEDNENILEEFKNYISNYGEDFENFNKNGYHKEEVTVGIKTNIPILILVSDLTENNDFIFLSKFKFQCLVNDANKFDIVQPTGIDIFKIFDQEYKEHLDKEEKINVSSEERQIKDDLSFKVNNTENSPEYLELLNKYAELSQDKNLKSGICRVVQKYYDDKTPELVEENKYKRSEVQYYGNYIYNCILNKYTNEVIMVDPSTDPFEDFNRIMYRLKFEGNKRKLNPKKTLEDIRNRKDVSFSSFNIDYEKYQNSEENKLKFKIIDTEDATDYQMRHIYFNEKYFLTQGERDDNFNKLAGALLSQKLSRKSYDFILKMVIKSFNHKHHPFGEKYFSVKLGTELNGYNIDYFTDINDINVLKMADKLSSLSTIVYNNGEEQPEIKRFKKRNQLITQKECVNYLRELTFESDINLYDNFVKIMGNPTISFKVNGIYHYSYKLDNNFITDELFESCEKIIDRIVNLATMDKEVNIKYGLNNMYYSNFKKSNYEDYKITSNKININKLKKL